MDINNYIRRIEYNGSLKPTLPVLRKLQKQHLLHVAFENLDIHYGRKIILGIGNFFEKIILKGRGGFCYELNGLFYALLSELGFEVKMVSATKRKLSDFEDMCEFHQTSPESHFTQNKLCSILTPDGRMTLTDPRLIIDDGSGHKETVRISDDAALIRELNTRFGISDSLFC